MSGIDAGQIALRIVWIHNGVAELKGGINWGAGNDTTGTGTPQAPYLTVLQALKEIRVVEGQKDITRTWEPRLLTDDDETNDYGDTTFNDDATIPDTPDPHIMILSGWLKTWGDTNRGKWATIAERPKHGRIAKLTIGALGGGLVRWVFVDTEFTSTSIILVEILLDANTFTVNPTALGKAYGCTFDWTTVAGTINRVFRYSGNANTVFSRMGFVGCFFKRKISNFETINDNNGAVVGADVVNCTFIPKLSESCLEPFDTRNWSILNCIVSPDGAGTFAIQNRGNSIIESLFSRHHSRYHRRGSSSFFRQHANGTADLDTFSKVGGQDTESSEGDPLLISSTNPIITDASPSLDKGGLHAVFWQQAFDPTNNNFHEADILRYCWGDSLDINTPSTANGDSKYSHRAIGCHQNLLGVIPDLSVVVWPIGIIQVVTPYVASPVPKDNDLLGTLQFRTFQASNVGLTADLVIKDSVPLVVDTTNNKINFKEDGGVERTATLVSGNYTTQELMPIIETAMQTAPSATGTYTATYDSNTELVTIAASGAVTNVQLLFLTGTDQANATKVLIGFLPIDTADQPSHVGTDALLENFFDSVLTYEFSSDYVSGLDPAVSGSWDPLGIGLPSDVGVEGTNGVSGEPADTRFVRVDLGTVSPLLLRYHAIQFFNGKFKSQNIEV